MRPLSAIILGLSWRFFALWAFWALIYLLFVGQLQAAELAAAALTGAAATVFGRTLARAADRPLTLPGGAAWLVLRGFAAIPRDCLRVGAVVLSRLAGRQGQGRFRDMPLRVPRDSGRAAGYRALLIAAISIAPGSVAVAAEGSRLLVHELRPGGDAPDTAGGTSP